MDENKVFTISIDEAGLLWLNVMVDYWTIATACIIVPKHAVALMRVKSVAIHLKDTRVEEGEKECEHWNGFKCALVAHPHQQRKADELMHVQGRQPQFIRLQALANYLYEQAYEEAATHDDDDADIPGDFGTHQVHDIG